MSGDLDFIIKPIVLVTGFGPYLDHPVNASWEGVKLINKDEIELKHNVELVLLELPVTYENVDEFVPELWETYNPELMIHVGVSRKADHFTLEMQAHRKGYQKPDYLEQIPANHVCTAEGAIRLHTKLDVEKICKDFNIGLLPDSNIMAVSSLDAGRYLCEYIYYTSLSIDKTRTLFVHVPDIPKYPSEVTARGLERILGLCLEQIKENKGTDEITNKIEQTNFADGDNDL